MALPDSGRRAIMSERDLTSKSAVVLDTNVLVAAEFNPRVRRRGSSAR